MFERYVNFDFYKTSMAQWIRDHKFERYVNFDFYKTRKEYLDKAKLFERYVNFDFYKTCTNNQPNNYCLRDM